MRREELENDSPGRRLQTGMHDMQTRDNDSKNSISKKNKKNSISGRKPRIEFFYWLESEIMLRLTTNIEVR